LDRVQRAQLLGGHAQRHQAAAVRLLAAAPFRTAFARSAQILVSS
jgi:hypothetical protein